LASLFERKAALSKLLIRSRGGIQYVEHADGHGERMFAAVCRLGLEGIVSKRSSAAYRSGPTRTWIKVKNPNAPAATRVIVGRFDPYGLGPGALPLFVGLIGLLARRRKQRASARLQ
jgi:ATP-dependent DNA ligase